MQRWKFAIVAIPIVMVSFVGCADQSPIAPSTPAAAGDDVSARPGATSGRYELSFYADRMGGWVPATSMPVLTDELILAAHVDSSSGVAATAGR